MLRELPDDVLDILASAFRHRILNHPSEDGDQIFDEDEATLIPKAFGAYHISKVRAIAFF